MRIVIISFYYPPDLSAGSFRTGALVEALMRKLGPADSVRVLTTAPNRYASFQTPAAALETHGKVTVERIALLRHESGLGDQLKAFFGFAREVMRRLKSEEADVVFATSSRLGSASLGALAARRCKAKLHLDIRDLFAENMSDMLRGPARVMLPVLRFLQKMTFRSADQISVVSPGFVDHVVAGGSRVTPVLRTNGIDDEFIGVDFHGGGGKPPVVLYAGNIGDGQGLSRLIPEAAARMRGLFRFRIIGDGGRRAELAQEIKATEARIGSPLDVELLPPMKRAQLMAEYGQADILLVHLNDYPAFRLVIPSKIFEYGATGKPIAAGISGVSATFVANHLANAELFAPCSVDGFVNALARLTLQHSDRTKFIAEFNRQSILNKLAREIIALAQPARSSS